MNIVLTTIWLNLKRNSNLLIIVFLTLFLRESAFAEAKNKLQQNLSFNNHYLDINRHKELFSFTMIYFYQLKYSQNNSLLKSLSILLSDSKKISFLKAKKQIKRTLLTTNNPIDFYRNIQK